MLPVMLPVTLYYKDYLGLSRTNFKVHLINSNPGGTHV